jgi:hypothetical protein
MRDVPLWNAPLACGRSDLLSRVLRLMSTPVRPAAASGLSHRLLLSYRGSPTKAIASAFHKERLMSDDKTQTAHDRAFINLSEPYEVRDWTNSLGVSEAQLREAVAAVGSSAEKVRQYLASQS